MAELIINRIEEGLFTHTLTVDGVTQTAIDNAPNLTSFWENGIRVLHFKTKNGAPLIKNQRILPSEINITDSFGGTPTQTGFTNDVQVWTALGELGYFQGFAGGSGSGGVSSFINLTDVSPNLYLGFGGMVYIVNEEETGLTPEIFYNYHLLTQNDDVSALPITSNDVGKVLAVQMDGTNPKFMLTDLPQNGVIIPNGFTDLGEQTLVDGEYTATVGYEWNYSNIHYGLIEDYTTTIDEETTGNSRIDVIHTIAGTNDFTKTVGEPSAGEGTALKPQIPVGSLELTQINIYEDNISEPTQPTTGFVESVTGNSVDNTDPLNPIIKAVPIQGTFPEEPITGDLEVIDGISIKSISENGGDPITSKVLFSSSVNMVSSLENGESSGIYLGIDNLQLEQITSSGISGTLFITNSGARVESTNPDSKGIVSSTFFNKQNDPNAFAQMGDVNWISSNEDLSKAKRNGDVLYGILDQYTGEEITLSKVTGTPAVDDVMIFQLGNEYFQRNIADFVNAKWWGLNINNTVSQNTTSIVSAIDYQLSKLGGKVYIPSGFYLVNPIHVKQFDILNIGVVIPIEIYGDGVPNQTFGTIGSLTLGESGTILKCETQDIYESVIIADSCPTSFENFSAVKPIIRNLQISTYQNSQIGGIDARFANQLIVENVEIDNSVYSVDSVLPTYASAIGIHTPRKDNGALTILSNVSVSGFYTGVRVNEHTDALGTLNLTCNRVALDFQEANHSSNFGKVTAQRNATTIKFSGAHSVNIANLNIENAGDSQTTPENEWQKTITNIEDPSNFGRGLINWYSVLGAFGNTPLDFRKNGGDYIKYVNLHENKIEVSSGEFDGVFKHAKNSENTNSRSWQSKTDADANWLLELASDFNETDFIKILKASRNGLEVNGLGGSTPVLYAKGQAGSFYSSIDLKGSEDMPENQRFQWGQYGTSNPILQGTAFFYNIANRDIIFYVNDGTEVLRLNRDGTAKFSSNVEVANATAPNHAVALGQIVSNTNSSASTLSLITPARTNYYQHTGTGATWTLPDATLNVMNRIVCTHKGIGLLKINAFSANQIWESGTASSDYSASVGESVNLYSDGVNWIVL